MSFQKELNTFISEKLNSNTAGISFNLFYRFGITQENFTEFIFNSVDWLDTGVGAENNVVVNYDGVDYNTQSGAYTLDEVNYIPCIIEDYIVEYEPLPFVKTAQYTIPITFFVNETVNKDLDPDIVDAIEEVQELFRGQVYQMSENKALFNHSDIKPLSGIIELNGTMFREYSMELFIHTISSGYFGNEIEYYITHADLYLGETTRVYPIQMAQTKTNTIHSFQKFNTTTNNQFEMKGVPNTSGVVQNLTFIWNDDELTAWLVNHKYSKLDKPKVINIGVKYPNKVPYTRDYVIQDISGLEAWGSLITVTVTLAPVSEVYN